jgi:hypothetical protein
MEQCIQQEDEDEDDEPAHRDEESSTLNVYVGTRGKAGDPSTTTAATGRREVNKSYW